MTTDNRTSEPTPEQVEVAAVASINSHRSRAGLPTLATLDCVPNADEWRDDARAVLVAAQGAAPQAEIAPKSSYISPHLPAQIRGLYRADLREKSIQTMLDLAGDLIQELIDLRAAPVLPSSGVDEERLAEYARVKQAEALEEAASSPIPREALTNGTRAWLRTRAEAYRQERGEQ